MKPLQRGHYIYMLTRIITVIFGWKTVKKLCKQPGNMSVWDRFFTVLSHFYRVKIFWRLWWREAMPEWSNHSFIYSFIYFSPFLIMFSHIFHCAVKVLVTLHLAPLPLLVIYTAGSYTYILYMCITVCTHTFVISMSSLYIII